MNIVLLEDEISQQVRVEKHVKAIAEEEGLRLNIVSTSKIAELKEYLTNGDFHQLFFLDIDIKGDEKAGIKAAQMIREVNPFAIIAFITTKSEFATITYRYKVSALEFIEKTLNENLFKEKIRECILYLKKNVIENKISLISLSIVSKIWKFEFHIEIYCTLKQLEFPTNCDLLERIFKRNF